MLLFVGYAVTRNQAPCTDHAREALYIRSLINTPGSGAHLVDENARVEPADFHDESHRAVISVIYELADSRARPYPADIETTLREPHRSNFGRIMQGGDTQPPAKLAIELKRLAKRRRAYEQTMRIAAAYVAGDDERAHELALELKSEGQEARAGEYMQAAEAIEHARSESKGSSGHMRTGFPALDRAIGQLRPQTLTVLGGYEGTGKSSAMLALAMNYASRGTPCGIISLEDPANVWGPRVLAHLEDVNPQEFDGARGETFDASVNAGIAKAKQLGLYFAFEEQQPLSKVLAAMRYLVRKCGVRVLFVDYLQCIRDKDSSRRHDYLSYAASRIKGQAQRLGVACVLGSQLNNPEKGKEFKEPRNTSLKESGDIKDMAEVIMLLWKSSDETDAKTFGKLSKVKWSPHRPRFEVVRNPRTGCVEGFHHG